MGIVSFFMQRKKKILTIKKLDRLRDIKVPTRAAIEEGEVSLIDNSTIKVLNQSTNKLFLILADIITSP